MEGVAGHPATNSVHPILQVDLAPRVLLPFSLNVHCSRAIFQGRGQRVSNVTDFSRATILYVDDDPAMREVMSLILSEEGFDVLSAHDGH